MDGAQHGNRETGGIAGTSILKRGPRGKKKALAE
jgi:hypothetical protein